jgi:hypothetical protein
MYLLALADGAAAALGARTGLLYTAQYLGPALLLQAMTWAGGGAGAASTAIPAAFTLGAACLLGAAGAVLMLAGRASPPPRPSPEAQPPGSNR